MRIAITHSRFTDGGVERYIRSLVLRLVDAGHEVHFFCHFWDEEPAGVHFHRVPHVFKPVRWLKVLAFDRISERLVRRHGPFDLVHGFERTSRQDLYTDGSGCLKDYQEYSLSGSWFRRRFGAWMPSQVITLAIEKARFTRGNFQRIIAMSELVRGQIRRRYGLDESEVEVIYNGIDLDRFGTENRDQHRRDVREELSVPLDAPVLLFVGSDYRRKGLDTFLRSLAKLPAARAFVLGRERPREERRYHELARALGLTDRVCFLGLRPDVDRYFAAADAFVLPTRFDAFGNVVLEAMATGLPTVVSARAGAAEVVVPGKTGAVFQNPEDAGELASVCEPYLNVTYCRAQGIAAREESERYSWDAHFARVLEIYEEIAAAGKAPRREKGS